MIGGAGRDVLDGGAGNDVAVFTGSLNDYAVSYDTATGVSTIARKIAAGSDTFNAAGTKRVTGDFNGDGKTDIAIGSYQHGGVSTYLSNGDASFTHVFSDQAGLDFISWPYTRLVAGDFNGDGRTDISVNSFQQGGIATYFSNGDGTYNAIYNAQTGRDWISWPDSSATKTFALDYDGDGLTDIGVLAFQMNGIGTYRSNGDGTFEGIHNSQRGTDFGSWPSARPLIGDFNNDGKDDIAIAAEHLGGIATYFSNGDGTFASFHSPHRDTNWSSSPKNTVLTGDFNGDGKSDIGVIGPGLGGIGLYLSNGDGSFQTVFSDQTGRDWSSWGAVKAIVGDFNNDAIDDIAVTADGLGGIAHYISNGDGTFEASYHWQPGQSWVNGTSARPIVADYDGDGTSDIVFSDNNLRGIAAYRSGTDANLQVFASAQDADTLTGIEWARFDDQTIALGGASSAGAVLTMVDFTDSLTLSASGDTVTAGSTVEHDQLWFEQTENDLKVSVIGTTNSVTLDDWYTDASNRPEFDIADGYSLTDGNIQALVNAMASFSPPALGETDLNPGSAQYDYTTVAAAIANNWQ